MFPLARMVDFGYPEAHMDRANNLHVLLQTGAHISTYMALDPNGAMLARQTHDAHRRAPPCASTTTGWWWSAADDAS